jgi:hypothetical protein
VCQFEIRGCRNEWKLKAQALTILTLYTGGA